MLVRSKKNQISDPETVTPQIRFSIVIATYNQEDFIKEAVDSALSQRNSSREVIVVDDNSSDRTAEILKSFGDSIRLEILPKNSGVYASRNRGASMATGEYLVFLDGDDVLMPRTLDLYESCITARYPKIILGRPVLFKGKVPQRNNGDIQENFRFVEYPDFFSKDRPGIYNTSALVVNREAFLAAGGWTHGIFYQDIQDLLTKMGVSGKMIIVLNPGTVWYRMHSTNAILKVPLFVEGIYKLLENEKAGVYPGGQKRKIQRSSWYGGLIYYWTKQSLRTGHVREGLKLLQSGWWMILLAMIRRLRACLGGRKPIELMKLK